MKKKLLRNASLVALSAVMVCGTAVGLAGCNDSGTTIVISMFCNDDDAAINKAACEEWAEEYSQKLIQEGTFEEGQAIKIRFSYNADTPTYFNNLNNQMASNSQPDVFYVSPKYVKSWSTSGRIVDLSTYLAEEAETLTDIWDDSLSFYAYSSNENFTRGEHIEFHETDGKYYSVDSQVPVGIYGLPKDFSNFGLSFNNVFFSEDRREELTSMYTTDRTDAKSAAYTSDPAKYLDITYGPESGIITDANGDDAPIINIGVPTTYKPYNFYRFSSYQAAREGGDPMAWMVEKYTGGKGYTVTIPGFPGDTLEEAAKYWKAESADFSAATPEDYQNTEAEYAYENSYVTYTYAEYSALTWAVTYYFNTFDWKDDGYGGVIKADGDRGNVYGNDQYDGTLYFLPWLAGNNATYLNADSTLVKNSGNETVTETQVTIDGSSEEVALQWGANSEAFIETLGAFYAYGSDWNGNSNNCGDTYDAKDSGWNLFIEGQQLFYGMGTWNGIETNKHDRSLLQVNLMPEPVSEDYALYSTVKDADYYMATYTGGELYTAKERRSMDTGAPNAPASYSAEEIFENQLERQDKWGARMDSVGYGVSAATLGEAEWKTPACVDLVKMLTIDPSMQATLTYSGSQLPNFKSMCIDFMNKEGEYFGQMITPDDGAKFDAAYQVAKDMYAARNDGGTIGEWMAANHPDMKYDPQFESTPMTSVGDIAYGMKVLYITAYTDKDRDLSLRMQFGLNFVRDSAMYTYDDRWLTALDPRAEPYVMAYRTQTALKGKMGDVIDAMLYSEDVGGELRPVKDLRYGTPKWWALFRVDLSQTNLEDAIKLEQSLMG